MVARRMQITKRNIIVLNTLSRRYCSSLKKVQEHLWVGGSGVADVTKGEVSQEEIPGGLETWILVNDNYNEKFPQQGEDVDDEHDPREQETPPLKGGKSQEDEFNWCGLIHTKHIFI